MQTKKLLVISLACLAVLSFSGCANKVHDYSSSTENILQIQSISKNYTGVKVGDFTDSGKNESKVMCRLATPVGTPKGETFAKYFQKAFKKELLLGGLYDQKSNIVIEGNLNDIFGSTILGNAYWEFDVTLNSSNGKSLNKKTRYNYESSFTAYSACSEMQRSFPLAVQKLNFEILSDPKFKSLLISK